MRGHLTSLLLPVTMEKRGSSIPWRLFDGLGVFARKCIFRILAVGPVPNHIAFIMDGNRRFAAKRSMAVIAGYRAGFVSMLTVLRYCYELGVKYVTVYAFSIENFKRKPEEVQQLMDLLVDSIEELLLEGSAVDEYGVRLCFIGNLSLLSESVRLACEKATKATAGNGQIVLLICMAYTSYDEIVHAVEESCEEKLNDIQEVNGRGCNGFLTNCFQEPREDHSCDVEESMKNQICDAGTERGEGARLGMLSTTLGEKEDVDRRSYFVVKSADIERHMYMSVAPDPDILIRSSGETRLSNFLLWQTSHCPLYSPAALWPEMGLRQFVWAVLEYQRSNSYLQKKRKQA